MLLFESKNPALNFMLAMLDGKEVPFNPESVKLTGEYAAMIHDILYYQTPPTTAIVLWNRPHPRWRKFRYKLKR